MKRFPTLAVAAGILCAIVAPGHARAVVIDFESVDLSNAPFAPLITDGDYVTQGGYKFWGADPHNLSNVPNMALVGGLFNGADPGSCLDVRCPNGNATNYLGALNDGIIGFAPSSGGNMILSSFDAAFLATADAPPTGMPAYLAIEANRSDGSFAIGIFALGAVGIDGTTAFKTYLASDARIHNGSGTLTSGDVTSMFAFAYYCNQTTGTCSAFKTNKGQFALDNIVLSDAVTPVPEAATWAMMLAGFGAIGAALRRQRKGIAQAA